MVPDSICAAIFAAPAIAAPDDTPANTPQSSSRRRSHSIDSRGRTMNFRSRIAGSKIGGTKPSSSERSPCTSSPDGGSTATTCTAGLLLLQVAARRP